MGSYRFNWRQPSERYYKIFVFPLILFTSSLVQDADKKNNPAPDIRSELESFKIAEGFEVNLFAADPMVAKPTQMNWDADGRLWVVSSTVYPHLRTGAEANDKIYVLEDTDGDGKADKSTVFAEGLLTPTGILPGDGGVYVANSTELLHFADTDGDGKADKKRRILGGFGTADTHHLIHTFRWGPDGYLYFNQSIYIYSHVETPQGIRRLEGGGVWQLNPKTMELNVYAKGLVNPWGLRFDDWGQTFLTDGAGGEGINYAFPGATFLTSPGAERIIRGLNPGQPKHCGLEIASGRHLPESWAGTLITNDFRANRVNRFKLEPQGSGYASKQQEDLLWTDRVAFRPIDVALGPDGAIYIADWYNPIIQHGEVDFFDPRRDQQRGRVWRVTAKDRPLVKTPKLSQSSVEELLNMLKLPEEWTRSQAKQVLKERGAEAVVPELEKWVAQLDKNDKDYEHHLLEGLWVYQGLHVINEPLLISLLNAGNYKARAAALRTLQHWYKKIQNVPDIIEKATKDENAQVRLEAVIALRKLESAEAARTALNVVEKPMDEFLDYALWQTMRELESKWVQRLKGEPEFFGSNRKTAYALKSVNNPEAMSQLMKLYKNKQVPQDYEKEVLGVFAKSASASDLGTLFEMITKGASSGGAISGDQLGTLEVSFVKRGVKPEGNLQKITELIAYEDDAIAAPALRLSGLWKISGINEKIVSLILKGDKEIQKAGLQALASMKSEESGALLLSLTEPKQPVGLRLLAAAQLVPSDPKQAARVTEKLLRSIPEQTDISDLLKAFVANKRGPRALAEALQQSKIPVEVAKSGRQSIQRLVPFNRQKDEDMKQLIQSFEALGGVLPAEKMPQQLSDKEIDMLARDVKSSADPARGELIYRKAELTCQTCHGIGGAGGRIGPDLSSLGTSSPTETIVRSILYPTHSIKEGYELQRVVKKDGSELMGYLVSVGSSEIVVRDVTGHEISVAKSQVSAMEKIPGSLMPPGLTAGLDKQEFMNLIAFLSKLGESGDFRVPNTRFVRRWEAMPVGKDLTKRIREEGLNVVAKTNARQTFVPLYGKVSGTLPLSELPVIEAGQGKKYSVARFDVEVLSKGNVKLAMNSVAGLSLWVGSKPVKLDGNDLVTDLMPGIHKITVAIDRAVFKEQEFSAVLQDADVSPAQTRLVMGK